MSHKEANTPLFIQRAMPGASAEELAVATENMRALMTILFTAARRILQQETHDSRESASDGRFQRLAPPRNMNSYYAYIRVSTVKQGERGSSLQEQRASIELFASRNGLQISQWFIEQETAAKRGRGEFKRMMAGLERGRVTGVILHKIDRAARNLWDWARIQDLIERGVEVHFAHDSVDLKSRGGRLSADIQAVVAADYVRNLRDEVNKGLVGRLKQGFWPWGAPIGYLDRGAAKAKSIDPVRGSLVLLAFELFASGAYTLRTLHAELWQRGLRSRSGKQLSLAQVARMLRNPFYIGVTRHRSTGELYQGVHEPLVPKVLFDRAQEVLDGRVAAHPVRHVLLYRRLVRCRHCQMRLIGEVQKGHTYYRCHTKHCPTKTVRERQISEAIDAALTHLSLTRDDLEMCTPLIKQTIGRFEQARLAKNRESALRLETVERRLARLMNGYLDGAVDKEVFQERHSALLLERATARDALEPEYGANPSFKDTMDKCFSLLKMLPFGTKALTDDELRSALKVVTSNLFAIGKYVVVELREPFRQLEDSLNLLRCGHQRHVPRTSLPEVQNFFTDELMFQLEETLRFWEPPASQVVVKAPAHWKKNLLNQRSDDDLSKTA
jgi:site-specific DNA recombinase